MNILRVEIEKMVSGSGEIPETPLTWSLMVLKRLMVLKTSWG
jgi:hypothetical protein